MGAGAPWRRFRVAIRRPTTVLGLLGLVLFGYLIVVPIVTMVIQRVTVGPRDTSIVQRPEVPAPDDPS